ncbi:MAG: LysM domain-containing protein [Bacillota bacterium]
MPNRADLRQIPPCPGGTLYTIRPGDSFFSLAQRFNTTVNMFLTIRQRRARLIGCRKLKKREMRLRPFSACRPLPTRANFSISSSSPHILTVSTRTGGRQDAQT